MKKSIVLLLMAMCAPFLVMAQNVVDDLYYVPTKANKEQAKAAEQKTEADAARKTVVVKSNKPATTVVVPEGTKVVVGKSKNKRSVDEYNRRYSGDATASNKEAVVNGETNYDSELDGEWVSGFDGNSDEYEYATRIIRFRNPRFAISISSPYYWDIVYGLNSWEWNVFVDDYYAYAFPTWSNRLWFDWRFSTVGWGWGWSTWYHPWYTSWYSPWYSPWHYGWYGGWYSPWYTGWYGGWYGGWHSPYHGYYGWGGYHYRPQNFTFRGQPGARSGYSNSTRRGGVGGNGVGVNGNNVRTRTANGTRVRSNDGTSIRNDGTRTRTTTNGRVVNGSNGTRVRTNTTGTRSNTNVTPNNGTRVRSNSSGTTINTRSGSTVRSSSGNNGTRTRSYSPSSSTQSNRSYSPGSSSSTRVRSNSTSTPSRSSSSTRSYSGSSSSRSYSGGGFSSGGSSRGGGGFSGGGGGSRGGGGGGGRSR